MSLCVISFTRSFRREHVLHKRLVMSLCVLSFNHSGENISSQEVGHVLVCPILYSFRREHVLHKRLTMSLCVLSFNHSGQNMFFTRGWPCLMACVYSISGTIPRNGWV